MKTVAPFSTVGVVFVVMVFLLWAWVEAQRCAATLPVGETGVAKGKSGRAEGDHPACTSEFPLFAGSQI
ncbi:hypothetical protein [Brucella endophytica]|uniref:hypothetical protein n=1 Tax=Brucella endophytica TaxID=1963359 RepID=UPI0016662FCB|nr:hypothetical protein [Brucella endophytica]